MSRVAARYLVFLVVCLLSATACSAELFYAGNGMGQELPHPALYPQGPVLLLSNSPEALDDDAPVVLYRDSVSGSFRVFLHHTNKAGQDLHVGIGFTNANDRPCHVALSGAPSGIPLETDHDPTVAGARAFEAWLNAHPEDRFAFDLAPGETHWEEVTLRPGATVTGMVDGQVSGGVPVTVCVASGYPLPTDPTDTPVAAKGPPFRRGTFPHGERLGNVGFDANVLSWLDVGSPPKGRWSRVSPGEYETGHDATTGQDVYNDGNFGVVYRLEVHVSPHQGPVSLMLDAAGGLSRFVLAVDGRPYQFPGPILAYQAWRFLRLDAEGGDFELLVTVPGGSNGAARLYFVPQTAEADLVGPRGTPADPPRM